MKIFKNRGCGQYVLLEETNGIMLIAAVERNEYIVAAVHRIAYVVALLYDVAVDSSGRFVPGSSDCLLGDLRAVQFCVGGNLAGDDQCIVRY